MSLLSDRRILEAMKAGRIHVEPFDISQLGTNSYDLRLASTHWIQDRNADEVLITNQRDAQGFWMGPFEADEYNELDDDGDYTYNVLRIRPGEMILAHTIEVAGARDGITTSLRCRSSIARSGLSIARCAGVGDVGYIAQWTMEIANHTQSTIIVPVGMRVAQIEFHEVGVTLKEYKGKYGQTLFDPCDMVPRPYLDRDLPDIRRGKYS